MSTTPNAGSEKEVKKPGSAGAPKPTNPARPSKFAGLNLRQRSSELPSDQPAAAAEPIQLLEAPAQERDQDAELTETSPTQAQEGPATAPNSPGAHPTSSRPIASTIESSSSSAVEPGKGTGQSTGDAESRQQSAMSKPVTSAWDVKHALADTAAIERAPTRRRGKRTHPDYVQVTAYVRQETYRRARIKLLESTKPQEFSEIVEDLLTRWLRSGS